MDYQVIWFFLWALLWAVYFMLDGFDFGVGILQSFLGKDDQEKSKILYTIGPVWDGNEVWLITATGATFAAFPTIYASMFSFLYIPLLLILYALIFRGVALEFWAKVESPGWKRGWGKAIFVGSAVPAFLFGLVFGNIFQGLAMDESGYHGGFAALFSPYGLLTALLFLLLFLVHGGRWLAWKTRGDLQAKSSHVSNRLWMILFFTVLIFMVATRYYTGLYENYLQRPILIIIPLLSLLSLAGSRYAASREKSFQAFIASNLTILTLFFSCVIGLYPNLIPSNLGTAHNLTIFNASSSIYTLRILTVVALIFVPIVIVYQIWIYRIFHQNTKQGQTPGGV